MKTSTSRDGLQAAIRSAAEGMQGRYESEGLNGISPDELSAIQQALSTLADQGDLGAELELGTVSQWDAKWVEPRSLYGLAERMQIPDSYSLVYKNSSIRGEMRIAYEVGDHEGHSMEIISIDPETGEYFKEGGRPYCYTCDQFVVTASKQANEMMGYPEDDMMMEDDTMMDETIPANTEASLIPAQGRVSDWRKTAGWAKQAFTGQPVNGYTNWDTFEVAMHVENNFEIYQAVESAGGPNALARIAEPMIRALPEYKDLEYAGGYIEWSNVDWEDVMEGRFTT